MGVVETVEVTVTRCPSEVDSYTESEVDCAELDRDGGGDGEEVELGGVEGGSVGDGVLEGELSGDVGDPVDEVDEGVDELVDGGDAGGGDRKSTRLNSSHSGESRMPSSA